MYTKTTSLTILYIRNIILDDMSIPSPAPLAWGGAMRTSNNSVTDSATATNRVAETPFSVCAAVTIR